MATVSIDGKEYDSDNLNEEAKKQLASIQFVQGEINRLNALVAVSQTALAAYTSALKSAVED